MNSGRASSITGASSSPSTSSVPVPGSIVLNASQWRQTRPDDCDPYTGTKSDYLASIEDELYEALGDLSDVVAEFDEDQFTGVNCRCGLMPRTLKVGKETWMIPRLNGLQKVPYHECKLFWIC